MQEPFEATLTAADLQFAAGVSDRVQLDLQFTPFDFGPAGERPMLTRAQLARVVHVLRASDPETVDAAVWAHPWLAEVIKADGAPGEGDPDDGAPRTHVRAEHRRLDDDDARAAGAITVAPSGPTGSSTPVVDSPAVPDPRERSDILPAIIQTELGMLFIDRTRFTPAGFALGERTYSMSLAPGEEVTLEQKTFTQRETSLEELSENEDTVERELTSTVSTEITNSVSRQLTDSTTHGVTAGGSAGFSYVVSVTASGQVNDSITAADQRTATTSVKQTKSITDKVTSKMRELHKTTFKVSTVDRFETSSKRVVRNPNPWTPIDLIYFKVLQKLRIRRERLGVRLCWAPAIQEPGRLLEAEIALVRQSMEQAAIDALALPGRPIEPSYPGAPPPMTNAVVDIELTGWDWFNHSLAADYDLVIPNPGVGYSWDGDAQFIRDSVTWITTHWSSRPDPSVAVIGTPQVLANGDVQVKVHAGAREDWRDGAHLYVSVTAMFHADTTALTAANQVLRDTWTAAVAAWENANRTAIAAAKASSKVTSDAWAAARRQNLDPRVELLRALVRTWFPLDARDEFEELRLWQELFDWEFASVRIFPGWWTGRSPFDVSADDSDFRNASWAQLYLPLRIGQERAALRWIYARRAVTETSPATEKLFDELETEIKTYRTDMFGDPLERPLITAGDPGECPEVTNRVVCLGAWEEYVPTDGTHVEVLQAASHAADRFGRQQAVDDESRRASRLEALIAENSLRDKVSDGLGTVTGSVSVQVDVTDSEA